MAPAPDRPPAERPQRGLRSWPRRLLRRSSQLNDAPLNKASLLVLVLIDLFLLVNILAGLNAIAAWPLSPSQAYPCQSAWSAYLRDSSPQRDPQVLRQALRGTEAAEPVPLPRPGGAGDGGPPPPSVRERWLELENDHLGRVDPICLELAGRQDAVARQTDLRRLGAGIQAREQAIERIEQESATIRRQYDSSLLEQIAGQPRPRALSAVSAAEARASLERNDQRLARLGREIADLERQVVQAPASRRYLALLGDRRAFQAVERDFARASFWHPSLQLLLQTLFLLPLVIGSLAVYRFANRRGHGLIALISWHLLVIALVPLLLKLFEFSQVGLLFQVVYDLVAGLVGRLLFLVSYLYILLIPLLGFGLIRLMQALLFNTRLQASQRVQRGRCLRCARRLQPASRHCPHCGYAQLQSCPHCGRATHRHLPHCRHCGGALEAPPAADP